MRAHEHITHIPSHRKKRFYLSLTLGYICSHVPQQHVQHYNSPYIYLCVDARHLSTHAHHTLQYLDQNNEGSKIQPNAGLEYWLSCSSKDSLRSACSIPEVRSRTCARSQRVPESRPRRPPTMLPVSLPSPSILPSAASHTISLLCFNAVPRCCCRHFAACHERRSLSHALQIQSKMRSFAEIEPTAHIVNIN